MSSFLHAVRDNNNHFLVCMCSEHAILAGTLSGHSSWVLSVAFSPDDKHFVTGLVIRRTLARRQYSYLPSAYCIVIQRSTCRLLLKVNHLIPNTS